jgi:NitT/TauT family transport system ATP-binding protein
MRSLSTAAAVSVHELSKKFAAPGSEPQFTVLDGVSLSVDEGNFVSIVGPSGCGKSTLLNIIAGIESYDGGSVTIAPRQGTSDHEPRIGYVFQSPRLLNWLTVAGNIEFALEAQKVPK